MTRKEDLPEGVSWFIDRHGKRRYRWRKTGFKTYYFKHPPRTKGFKEELDACRNGVIIVGEGRAVPRSVSDLCTRYYGSTDFNSGGPDDQQRRRLLIESFRVEFGNDLVVNFHWDHIETILLKRSEKRRVGKRMVGGKVAALNLRKQLRRLFAYAKKLKWITSNPVDEAATIKTPKTKGYHS